MADPKIVAPYPEGWQFETLDVTMASGYQPPPWILKDLLPDQSGLLCSGMPHAGKSLNWLAAAMGSVLEHKVWGHFDASKVKRAAYIETEDPKWMLADRIQGLATGFGLDPREDLSKLGFASACLGPFNLIKMGQQLENFIGEFEPDWVVLSTLQGLLGGRNFKEQ